MPPENEAQEVFTFIIIVNNDELPASFLLRFFFYLLVATSIKELNFIKLHCIALQLVRSRCIVFIILDCSEHVKMEVGCCKSRAQRRNKIYFWLRSKVKFMKQVVISGICV